MTVSQLRASMVIILILTGAISKSASRHKQRSERTDAFKQNKMKFDFFFFISIQLAA